MEIKSRFDHFNINVTDLNAGILLRKGAGFWKNTAAEAKDGSFILVYLTDSTNRFPCWNLFGCVTIHSLYELGEKKLFVLPAPKVITMKYASFTKRWTAFVTKTMTWDFIFNDPDGYWIEIFTGKVKKQLITKKTHAALFEIKVAFYITFYAGWHA